ncbi:MAG TPA: tRNA preQ1(34) S-adenosylmethionine ribosyltransferase-isomerase QueA [Candidatus Acidoferrum sp.]|nr:tRNA preQ1(34) S-adenosylmethionine ribosyltransferase-isomerase QueA [Candidatus Acidoferrum sp.]
MQSAKLDVVMRPSEFDYALPATRIAQHPLKARDASRMLLFDRVSGACEDRLFADLPELLRGNELIVVNNARVIPARLLGRRIRALAADGSAESSPADGEIEILLSRQLDDATWEALVRPGKKLRVGQRLQFGGGELAAEIIAHSNQGERTLRFSSKGAAVIDEINRLGHIPLPPYIDRPDEASDHERYQTIFASRPGAIAAPTAGLHFTPEILEKIRKRGIEICELTLHVGLGTFQPIRTETLEAHAMHSEGYEIPGKTAKQICDAKNAGRPILSVGTTTVRALETAAIHASESGSGQLLTAGKAEARLFITPGFRFRVVDALLTNFHLPQSTLLALVCAMGGREGVLAAYDHAVKAGYRFYSYGDCMLIR